MDVVTEAYRDGVFSLTLNRPEKKNAMSLELLEALYRSLKSAETQGASIVVIRGAGKTFCSGGDVVEFRDSAEPALQVDSMADFLNRSISLIRNIPADRHSGGRGSRRGGRHEPQPCVRPYPRGDKGGDESGIPEDRADPGRRWKHLPAAPCGHEAVQRGSISCPGT